MKIEKLDFHHLQTAFRTSFGHASAIRSKADSVVVRATTEDGTAGYGEGCPRPYVSGESSAGALAALEKIRAPVIDRIRDYQSLVEFTLLEKSWIDRNPAAWCAMELALLDALQRTGQSNLYELFGRAPGSTYSYTAVIGSGEVAALETLLQAYASLGFDDFKIKLNGQLDSDRARLACLAAHRPAARIRLDANNLWRDHREAGEYLAALPRVYFAVEEPLSPRDYAGLDYLASRLDCDFILDESLVTDADLSYLRENPQRVIANLRLSKLGGLLRTRTMLEEISSAGIRHVIGAHVGESGLLTRAAMLLGDDRSPLLLGREGAAGEFLLVRDLLQPSIRFGAGGSCRDDGFFDARVYSIDDQLLAQPHTLVRCGGQTSRIPQSGLKG